MTYTKKKHTKLFHFKQFKNDEKSLTQGFDFISILICFTIFSERYLNLFLYDN